MSSGKATASDWGSYYHNTASDSSGSKVTNSGAHYTYNPDGSAYYTDNNGNRTQLSDKRGSTGYVNGEFHGDGNGGHTAVGYDPSYSGVSSAPRELTSDEKAYYDNLVQQAMQQKYGWSAGSVGSTAGNNGYNADLQYALKQSGMTADQYRQDLLNRVGTLRSDGRYVTQAEIDTELNRLGLNNLQTGGQGNLYKTGDTLDVFGDGNLWVLMVRNLYRRAAGGRWVMLWHLPMAIISIRLLAATQRQWIIISRQWRRLRQPKRRGWRH